MPITYHTDPTTYDYTALHDALIADDFHNGRTVAQYAASYHGSFASVLVTDGDRVVATARMLADGVCNALVVDVWTHSDYRRQGIGREMMRMLEAQVPGHHVALWTDDMGYFYAACGYEEEDEDILYQKVVGKWLDNTPR